jgi:signal transduction histidine kinase
MFGYDDPAETVGLHWSTLYTPEEATKFEEIAVPQVFANGHWRGEARGLRRDGQVIEQEVALAVSPDGGLVCTTRDIGDRQRTLRERIRTRERLLLAERQEMIARAVSGLAHDFANLTSVISVSAMSLEERGGPDVRELARIRDPAMQANAMLDKILAPEKALPSERVVEARSALQSVAELTAVSLRPHHRMQVEVGDEDLCVAADPTEFMRVLLNLCTNARDALTIDEEGLICIAMERFPGRTDVPVPLIGSVPVGPSVLITVTDSGCGIAKEDLERVFEPFHTKKSDGTGLGLAVVSAVVAKSGGCLSVESGSWGTCFYLLWPLGSNVPETNEAEMVVRPADLSGWRILVTDDNPAVLELIGSELRKAGAEVGSCETPLEAIAVLEDDATNWDALVVDYDMPGMNGAQLAAAVRSRWPSLPIILCSALHEVIDGDPTAGLFDARVAKSAVASGLPREILSLLTRREEEVR